MTLRHMRLFLAVCETGSVTAASGKLYIAQPTVSLAISELEDYYGVKLFDRISKRLHITEAGRRFQQYAVHIIGLFEEMEKGIRNYDAVGLIRIGASVTIGNYLLPGYVSEFKETHPGIEVQVRIANSDTIERGISDNTIDVGLIEGIVHSPNIIASSFRDDELVMICSVRHRFANQPGIDLPEMQKEAFLMRETGSAGREIFDSLMTLHGIEIRPSWESTSTQAIIRAVGANLGISVLPYLLVRDAIHRKEISRFGLKDISLRRQFSVIYHKNKFITQGARDFIDLCR